MGGKELSSLLVLVRRHNLLLLFNNFFEQLSTIGSTRSTEYVLRVPYYLLYRTNTINIFVRSQYWKVPDNRKLHCPFLYDMYNEWLENNSKRFRPFLRECAIHSISA
jgi:hypothetical protein